MAGAAAIGLIFTTLFGRPFPLPVAVLALGLGSAVAVATFIALMSYLMASSDFNVANVHYTSPASSFVLIRPRLPVELALILAGHRKGILPQGVEVH